jgi:hypothetical protein
MKQRTPRTKHLPVPCRIVCLSEDMKEPRGNEMDACFAVNVSRAFHARVESVWGRRKGLFPLFVDLSFRSALPSLSKLGICSPGGALHRHVALVELPRAISFSCELRFGKHKRTQCAPAADRQHTHRRRLAASTYKKLPRMGGRKTKPHERSTLRRHLPNNESHNDKRQRH